VILIHGLGLSRRSWVDLCESCWAAPFFRLCATDIAFFLAFIAFFYVPICLFLPMRLSRTPPFSFGILEKEGHGILTWSQENRGAESEHAVGELQTI
jgi:hypothetical protein